MKGITIYFTIYSNSIQKKYQFNGIGDWARHPFKLISLINCPNTIIIFFYSAALMQMNSRALRLQIYKNYFNNHKTKIYFKIFFLLNLIYYI